MSQELERPINRPNPASATNAPFIVPLREANNLGAAVVGSKAAALSRLMAAGFPVPSALCLTTHCFQLFMSTADPKGSWRVRLQQAFDGKPENLAEVGARLRHHITRTELPESVLAALRSAFSPLLDFPVAVRSSATAEDLPGSSFAGQFDSFLNVQDEPSLLDAVRQCYASLYQDRSLAYHQQRGFAPNESSMAILIQTMVPADLSGVAFTADPVNPALHRIVIEAVPGLGDQLVSGRATPERVVLEKSAFAILERYAPPSGQPATSTTNSSTPATTRLNAQPPSAAHQLGIDLAGRIAQVATKVEQLFGCPQDIEWAVSERALWLIQSRPITSPGPPLPPEAAGSEIWTLANAVENFPYVLTPMAWSLLKTVADDFLDPLLHRLAGSTKPRPLIGRLYGRAYVNLRAITDAVGLLTWKGHANFTSVFGGYQSQIPNLDQLIGRRKRSQIGFNQAFRLSTFGCGLLPYWFRQQHHLDAWGKLVDNALGSRPLTELSDTELSQLPSHVLGAAGKGHGWSTTAAAAWMAIYLVSGFTAVCFFTRRWLGDSDGSLANRLLSRAGGMDSAEPAMDLWRLASWCQAEPSIIQLIQNAPSFTHLQKGLARLPAGIEFLTRWQQFLDQHGHQARSGMDVSTPRWQEMPDYLLGLLKTHLAFTPDSNPDTRQAEGAKQRQQHLVKCRRQLRNPLKFALLQQAIKIAQRGLVQRENVKQAGIRMVGCLRRIALEAGHRLKAKGALDQPDDVFFIAFAELSGALQNHGPVDLRPTVAERRADWDRWQQVAPPPVIIGDWSPPVAQPTPDGVWHGVGVSPGVATGRARVIHATDTTETVLPGEILVAPFTDPGWTPYFLPAAALVVDIGGLLSHGSVVAREYGIPAVVNVGPASKYIRTGQMLRVDGGAGMVEVLPGQF